jgi:hypothetical protein
VIDAIHDRNLREIEWAYPVQAGHVHGIQILVRSSLVMCVYSAAKTEEMLHRSSVEAVACQRILALQDLDPTHFRHDNDSTPHSAVRASAAADRIEAVTERHLKTHRTAMALASPNVRVTRHVVCVTCSDHIYASIWDRD